MWRRIDLHNHTHPNERHEASWDADAYVQSAIDSGLDVVAITDHDKCDVYESVRKAAGDSLVILPGVEITTSRGHILVISAGTHGASAVEEFCARLGVRPGYQVEFGKLLDLLAEPTANGQVFAARLITIAAHADLDGHLLGSNNQLSLERQLDFAQRMTAIEVARDEVFVEWQTSGVKQGPKLVLTRGSDTHDPTDRRPTEMHMYLPEVTIEALHHAFALPECSISFEAPAAPARYFIKSLQFSDGPHAGPPIEFCERANAVIGPPNAGKSLLVDAVKFVFGVEAQIPEVEEVTTRRLAACLPNGTEVTATVVVDGVLSTLTRIYGGTDKPTPPFRPIIFSQTELIRRSHEARPSIRLLDVHCPEIVELEAEIDLQSAQVSEEFQSALGLAQSIRTTVDRLANSEDGLAATAARLEEASGAEPAAKRAAVVSKIEVWRDAVKTTATDFSPLVNEPEISAPPSDLDDDLADLVPAAQLLARAKQLTAEIQASGSSFAQDIQDLLVQSEERFLQVHNSVKEALSSAGFAAGTQVTQQLKDLQERLAELESSAARVKELERELEDELVSLRASVKVASSKREAVTTARRRAASVLNESMRSFFAVVTPGEDSSVMAELLKDLKTGTRMRAGSWKKVSKDLDRAAFLEYAIRHEQGREVATDLTDEQKKLVLNALDRDMADELVELATTWADDGLDLKRKVAPGQKPVSFDNLTEGLRALAIKEVSFAASDLPVVTDQPEDAVPTRSVFESLVPTIRHQRATRQFIVVSHDANIVVASDVETVTAIHCAEDGSTHSGSLFDRAIRDLALEHLEGGHDAFERRSQHYARPHIDQSG